jgi:hypothetical protein
MRIKGREATIERSYDRPGMAYIMSLGDSGPWYLSYQGEWLNAPRSRYDNYFPTEAAALAFARECAEREHRQSLACEVCGNWPNEEGELEHGRGCYTLSQDGGGFEYVEVTPPDPLTITLRPDVVEQVERQVGNNRSESFDDLCNRVARDIPEGWTIRINLERHAGWVQLKNAFGESVEFPTNDERMSETVNDAMEHVTELTRKEPQ